MGVPSLLAFKLTIGQQAHTLYLSSFTHWLQMYDWNCG